MDCYWRINNLFGIKTKKIIVSQIPQKIESGLYLVTLYHDGNSNMNQISFLSVTGYDYSFVSGHENKFYTTNNLISNNPTIDNFILEFNPVTCEIKLKESYQRVCLLIKLNID